MRSRAHVPVSGVPLLLSSVAAVLALVVGVGVGPVSALEAIGAALGRSGPKAPTADGGLPDGTRASDTALPGITRLDPALRRALVEATAAGARDGVQLTVNSGWRSQRYQDRLWDDAVERYGSTAEAARWVAPGSTSRHLSGDATDIGPVEAAQWLGRHGERFGLCRVFANEPWHFELLVEPAGSCPGLV